MSSTESSTRATDALTFIYERRKMQVRCASDFIALLQVTIELNLMRAVNYDVSFRSLLFAMTIAEDADSRWLNEQLSARSGIIEKLLSPGDLGSSMLEKLIDRRRDLPPPRPEILATANALLWIQAAIDQSQDATTPIAVNHLVRALLNANPPLPHTDELLSFGFDIPSISISYDEWRHASGIRADSIPNPPPNGAPFAVEQTPSGEDTNATSSFSRHLESDIATTLDQLNYALYRDAIREFVIGGETRWPLSISIQAPWGAGKSSLMRMIREVLDPKYRNKTPLQLYRDRSEKEANAPHLSFGDAVEIVNSFRTSGKVIEPGKILIDDAASDRYSITVWFNAWKYENSSQVWAGLVDAIIAEVSDRMQAPEREKFFLKLNLKRIDANKIREILYEQAFARWLKGAGAVWTAVGAAAGAAIGAVLGLEYHAETVAGLLLGSIGTASVTFASTFMKQAAQLKSEKAGVTLHDLVSVPRYDANVGFVHEVEHDLRNVLEVVPNNFWPLVVFIDDLDRCTPQTVGKVMEGINLFLAGDFRDFVFVIGMDTELVAAALDLAHKDVLACVASDARVPLGWRFMDKFVQLPFVIPPATSEVYDRYLRGMLSRARSAATLGADTPARPNSPGLVQPGTGEDAAADDYAKHNASMLREQAQYQERLQQTVATFDESDPVVVAAIEPVMPYFGRNPRDLKRFLNALRLHVYLTSPLIHANATRLSLVQVVAWTLLTVKWPDVVRWIRRGDTHKPTLPQGFAEHRVMLLEEAASGNGSFEDWKSGAAANCGVPPDTTWLRDLDHYRFWRDVIAKPTEDRLTAGIGKGLW